MKTPIQFPPVLLTNIHERSALVSLRTLRDYGVKVICSTTVKGLSRVDSLDDVKLHPCPNKEFVEFKNWIQVQLDDTIDLLVFPINEAIIYACDQLCSNNNELYSRFIMPTHTSLKYSLSKYYASRAAQHAGIRTPHTYFIKEPSSSELILPDRDLQFPQILKWDNALTAAGKYEKGNLRVVHSQEEMEDTIAELVPSNPGIILQDLVPGNGVGAFFLRQNGKILLRFAHQRIHESPWTGGVSSYCESSEDKSVLDAGEHLLETINFEGVAMVEFRKEKGMPPVFLEINGRLWGSLGLALKACVDFPRAMLEYHQQQEITVSQPSLKKKFYWHEPGLEMMYLRSLWDVPISINGEKSPKVKGVIRVVFNFINPLVGSDWMNVKNPLHTGKRYIKLILSQLIYLAMLTVVRFRKKQMPFHVQDASERTKLLQNQLSKVKYILFVCYGNICRSPYAEAKWQIIRKQWPQLPNSYSVGFHQKVKRSTPKRFQSVALHLGVELEKHRSRCITDELVNKADIIIAMDKRNLVDMQKEFPDAIPKTILLGALSNSGNAEIEDPYEQKMGTGGAVYRRINNELNHLKDCIISDGSLGSHIEQ